VGLRVLLTAACAVAVGSACAPNVTPSHAAAARAARGTVTTRAAKAATGPHQAVIHPGVQVQRLDLGPAFHPTCPPRTMIGTAAAPRVVARTRPADSAPAIASFPRVNEQGVRQVFDLLQEVRGPGGNEWYSALLPMRPNDTLGYIPANTVAATWTDYWILVERGAFRLTLYKACHAMARFPVGIGEGSTPTPVGIFYLQSLLRPPDPNSVYGTYAYGLAGYSAVIHDWRWGGIVGLHGTDDPSGTGHVVSHGCLRMFNKDIDYLARLLPVGTPIAII